jgi:aminoglycoside 6'-N-acetyltransferase
MDEPRIKFRPMRREDFALLKGWLEEPLVACWWNHDSSPQAVDRDFGPSVDGHDATRVFVAVTDERPFGLVQRYPVAAYPEYLAELSSICPVRAGAFSIDYLIGDPGYRGRGLAARMIVAMLVDTWARCPQTDEVVVPVAVGNVASWRALERAAFRRIAEGGLTPDNPRHPREHYVYSASRPCASAAGSMALAGSQ